MPERRSSASMGGKARKLVRLQTLWSLYFTHRVLPFLKAPRPSPEYQRQLRLGWMASKLGLEELASFKDLNWEQLDKAIDAVQRELPADLVKRKRPSRDQAHRMGTEGRSHRRGRRGRGAETEITGPPDTVTLNKLADLRQRAGLSDDARFAAWLRSRSSPTGGSDRLNTLGKVNAVIWALKRMVRENEKRTAEAAELAEVTA